MNTISNERVINAIKKYGNGDKLYLPKDLHVDNDWNAWAIGVALSALGKPMVWCYIQGGSTDSDDFVFFSEFFKDGKGVFHEDYHGWKYSFSQAEKQAFADNLKKYVEQLEGGLGDKKKAIEKLKDWAGLINPIANEWYRKYNLRWANGGDIRYKAYRGAENELIAHIEKDWQRLSKMGKTELGAEYRKVFENAFNRLLNA